VALPERQQKRQQAAPKHILSQCSDFAIIREREHKRTDDTDKQAQINDHGAPLCNLDAFFGLPAGFLTKPFAPGRLFRAISAFRALRSWAESRGLPQWGQFIWLAP